MRLLGYLYR